MIKILIRGIKAITRYCLVLLGLTDEEISRFKKRIYQFLFCVVFGLTSASILFHHLRRGRAGPRFVHGVSVPKPYGNPGGVLQKRNFPESAFYRLDSLNRLLDSLRLNDKRSWDSLLRGRPGLADSIRFFKRSYHAKQKNKKEY